MIEKPDRYTEMLNWWSVFIINYIQERMAQTLQFSYWLILKRRKQRPLANHIIVIVDHGGW